MAVRIKRDNLSNDHKNIGYLNSIQRLCVMISRAKNKLYFVGNYNMFFKNKNKTWNKIVTEIKLPVANYEL